MVNMYFSLISFKIYHSVKQIFHTKCISELPKHLKLISIYSESQLNQLPSVSL